VLLVGGEQSSPFFRRTLDALAAVLPRARLATIPRAGHMLHAEAPTKFADLLIGFAAELYSSRSRST
jgi:pimeloyl-ACP methyl ester carboxylesterase